MPIFSKTRDRLIHLEFNSLFRFMMKTKTCSMTEFSVMFPTLYDLYQQVMKQIGESE